MRCCKAWDTVEHVLQERIGSRVVLVKQWEERVTSFSSDFKSGWWSISLDVVRQAIRAFSWVSLVCVAGSVYKLKGLPIGGVLSGLCLSVVLGKQEYEWNANRLDQIKAWFKFGSFRVSQCVAVLRYVDDILLISLRYCRQCLVEFAKSHVQSRSLLPPMLHVTCLPPVWLLNGWIWTCMRLDGMCVWHQRTSIESGCIKVWIRIMVFLSCERNAHFWSGQGGHRWVSHCWRVELKMRIARARSLGLSEIMSAIRVLQYLLELF